MASFRSYTLYTYVWRNYRKKKQLSLFVFWSPNQEGDWIHFYHISEVTGEQSQLFPCDRWMTFAMASVKDKPMFCPGTPRPQFPSACTCREYQMYCSSACSLSSLAAYQGAYLISLIGDQEDTSQERCKILRTLAMHDQKGIHKVSFISQGKSLPCCSQSI